jgi:hypothetical protein
MPSINPRIKLHSMKYGNLVKSSKNMKFWRMPIISRLTLSTLGTFHSLTNFFFLLNQKIKLENPYNSTK